MRSADPVVKDEVLDCEGRELGGEMRGEFCRLRLLGSAGCAMARNINVEGVSAPTGREPAEASP